MNYIKAIYTPSVRQPEPSRRGLFFPFNVPWPPDPPAAPPPSRPQNMPYPNYTFA